MKSYSRDWMVPGRVRVKLRNDDGSPVNPDIPSREWERPRAAPLSLSSRGQQACCLDTCAVNELVVDAPVQAAAMLPACVHRTVRLQSNPRRRSHFPGAARSRGQPRASSTGLYLAALPLTR